MLSRECQSDWFVDLILDELGDDEEVFILGKSFKPETNLLEGSPSILLANLIEEYQYAEVHFIDPHVDGTSLEPRKMGKALYFVGTKHECFKGYTFEEGSVVIDPFRYIEDQPGVKVIRIGE
jgi:UDP-N-acetyl-D-mannosaminuronate dehydrogenase